MSIIEKYKGFLINNGIGLNPGSGTAIQHEKEYNLFQNVLSRVDNKTNPVMIELGSHWALWSLCFKYKFNGGFNILIELLKSRLEIGVNNFNLNNYNFKSYHGGILVESAMALSKTLPKNEYGLDLNIVEILNENKIEMIDILHMDIQGSELNFIKHLDKIGLLKNNINQLVIGTHSSEIHDTLLDILKSNEFEIFDNIPYGLGGDGLLTTKKK